MSDISRTAAARRAAELVEKAQELMPGPNSKHAYELLDVADRWLRIAELGVAP